MLIYLDFATAAHETTKKWFKQTEIKMQSYGLKASQRTRNKGWGQMPTCPAGRRVQELPEGLENKMSLSQYLINDLEEEMGKPSAEDTDIKEEMPPGKDREPIPSTQVRKAEGKANLIRKSKV